MIEISTSAVSEILAKYPNQIITEEIVDEIEKTIDSNISKFFAHKKTIWHKQSIAY